MAYNPANQSDWTYGNPQGLPHEYAPQGYNLPDDTNLNYKGSPYKAPEPKEDPYKILASDDIQYDPESELASFLYMMCNGQIETASFDKADCMKVVYHFIQSNEWEVIHGRTTNESQYAYKNHGQLCFNMDFDIGYRALSPFGWPQLVIQCKGPNLLGKEVIKAYGCVHIPTTPGRHTRFVRMFCPVSDKWSEQIKAYLFGPDTEFTEDPEKIANAEGREITTIKCVGNLRIVFQISQRNFGRFGYSTSTSDFQDDPPPVLVTNSGPPESNRHFPTQENQHPNIPYDQQDRHFPSRDNPADYEERHFPRRDNY